MAIVKKIKRGFTLIELMIVVVIIGVLAALAIYGVQKYVANAKSAEARQMLGRMSKDQLNVFEGENQTYKILSFGQTADISRAICPAAGVSNALPGNEKVQPTPATFRDNAGWECMRFAISTPVYYQYLMSSPDQGASIPAMVGSSIGDTFTAVAQGDLDGDTNTSLFELGGQVKDGGSNDIVLVLATTINETDAEE